LSERNLVQQLGNWLGGRTLIVTTNRPGLLELVDRIVVIDNGRIALDGPKAKVLAALSGGGAGAAADKLQGQQA
jgi:ATP-binding cassette, subfamily C, bacterial LapB